MQVFQTNFYLTSLILALSISGCTTTSDFTLLELVKEIGSSSTLIQRPASSLSILGYEQANDQLGNSILRQGKDFVSTGQSWTTRTLTYANKSKFDIDFSYYVETGAGAGTDKTGNATLKSVSVERITNAVPDIRSARLMDAFQEKEHATAVFKVFREQIRATEISFDGNTKSGWNLSAKPALALPNGITAKVGVNDSISVSGKGRGNSLVLAATPSTIEISKTTTKVDAGRSASIRGYQLSLQEIPSTDDEFELNVSVIQQDPKTIKGSFGSFVELPSTSNTAFYLVIEKIIVGHYRYSLHEFFARWADSY